MAQPSLLRISALVCLVFAFVRPSDAADHPNILVILSDDQGWGDLSVHGNTNLNTPAIDSLARDGALFERFYVCPVCSPTRAEFLTGRYHTRGGVRGVSTGGERLDLDERTIAQVFRSSGYATAAFGKWHNGTQYPYHPIARGFDEFYGFTSGHWGEYFDPLLDHNGRLVKGTGYLTDDLTDHAIRFITENRDQLFFCYVPFNVPHSPMQVPDKYFQAFENKDLTLRNRDPQREDPDFTRAALAMCEGIDANVGRLLKTLDDLHLSEQTIVVYFSDNGPNSWRWNGGMKGKKGSTDEGGVRAPLLIRWPGHIEPGTRVPTIAAAIDLLPTLAELAHVSVIGGKPLDGVSLTPVLTGHTSDWPDRSIFSHWNGHVSLRTQRFRLDDTGHLFDMDADPGQDHDIAADHPEIASKLSKDATLWKAEMLPQLGKDDRPFTVGYPAMPTAFLPARDGVAHGTVQRSANAPNCSFFTHWTSPDDRITWDIDVATPGLYEVVVYYTCAPENLGCHIEATFQDQSVRAEVKEAFNPPLRGADQDRVIRHGESYVKDFHPLTLGSFSLSEGRGPLALHAPRIPGHQAVDVRMVALKLLDHDKP